MQILMEIGSKILHFIEAIKLDFISCWNWIFFSVLKFEYLIMQQNVASMDRKNL